MEKVVMKKRYLLFILPLFLIFLKLKSSPTIVLSFDLLPDKEAGEKIKKPGKIAKHTIKGMTHHTPMAGILATYGGYLNASDYDGYIRFPRKHEKPSLELIVTTKIIPITMFENTIHHWQLEPGNPAAVYAIEQKYDEGKKYHYWQTTKVAQPENDQIPMTAIVIIANPDKIIIDNEATPTHEGPNLILPPIYAKKGSNMVNNSLYMLNLRHLFKFASPKYNAEPLRLTTHINE